MLLNALIDRKHLKSFRWQIYYVIAPLHRTTFTIFYFTKKKYLTYPSIPPGIHTTP